MPVARRTCPVAELPADQQAVIDALAEARLVTTDTDRAGRRVAELAHEFLLHAWPRLADLAEQPGSRERGGVPIAQHDGGIVRGIVPVDEKLLAAARQRALLRGQTLGQFVEGSLRRALTATGDTDCATPRGASQWPQWSAGCRS